MPNIVKFEFVTFNITRKNYLYSILNVEIHLDAMSLSDTIKEINKTFEQLICSCNNNIVKKRFHKYYEFISCLCMVEQSSEAFDENHEICPTGSAPFPEVNASINIMNLFHVFVWLSKS